ncbi:Prolyl oligopeptidase family protein (fragment) [Paraburkholderia piptadeniae]|uniref:Prolyl oligopeptidase family protein n=1 Tax=Paraburkholderia piptadeniae TaxID=1701573 RepID=A0A1N7SUG3_9BURK
MLAIVLAGCGGGGDSAGTDPGALGTSAKALAAPASAAANSSRIIKLQRYQIDPTKVFIAGISSGGFAAVQMHVAHSSTFKGAAV